MTECHCITLLALVLASTKGCYWPLFFMRTCAPHNTRATGVSHTANMSLDEIFDFTAVVVYRLHNYNKTKVDFVHTETRPT